MLKVDLKAYNPRRLVSKLPQAQLFVTRLLYHFATPQFHYFSLERPAMAVIQALDALCQEAKHNTTISASLLVLGAWACWWLWRFMIIPRLRPDDPRELPYLIPCGLPL
jgi:hypothetical protein